MVNNEMTIWNDRHEFTVRDLEDLDEWVDTFISGMVCGAGYHRDSVYRALQAEN